MIHGMVDIETLGTAPGCYILSIGAVLFNPDEKGDGILRSLYARIGLGDRTQTHSSTDHGTLLWWLTQDEAVRKEAFEPDAQNRMTLPEALTSLARWGGSAKRWWCHGATFDVPILTEAYSRYELPEAAPWRFHSVRDTRTLYELADEAPIRIPGEHHNALADARAQALAAVRAIRKLQGRGQDSTSC